MQIIELDQGTDAWLKFRESHITATDVSAIMGINPWKTSLQLWQDKLGMNPPIVQNERMKRGQDLEPIARQILIEETGIDFKPVVCVHSNESWAMASLDGWCDSNKVVAEIKCPNLDTHQFALSSGIKEYYISQVQWQLWVTGAKMCYYFSYMPEYGDPIAIIEVFPNDEYIHSMVETCRKFYLENLCGFKPPEGPKKFEARN